MQIDIYLITPYSHPDPAVRESRYIQARDYVQRMTALGLTCFSPIVYFHEMAKANDLGWTHADWAQIDSNFQRACRCCHVLTYIDGWQESVGVKAETKFAFRIGQPVREIYTPEQAI